MARIIKRNKALSVRPLKAAPTLGAALAFMGVNRCIPLLHGSQGCTAFAKIFLIQHFREPMPMQTTAIDQISAVMGSDDNVLEALKTLCDKSAPDMIGLVTTGLSELQGSDVNRLAKAFREQYPEHRATTVVPVSAPDFNGCFESGFAAVVESLVGQLPMESPLTGTCSVPAMVNVLAGSLLTPGDIEELKDIFEFFGLHARVLPDLSGSLDGHLTDADFNPVTAGGTPVAAIRSLTDATATVTVGSSLYKAADRLVQRGGPDDYRFPHLHSLDQVDKLLLTLSEIAGRPVPQRFERQRSQLQDAMLDTHFMLGGSRIALALEPDLLLAYRELVAGMGAVTGPALTPAHTPFLPEMPLAEIKIGDLQDLETMLGNDACVDMIISNSHASDTAQRYGIPLFHAGFPQYDVIGGYRQCRIGYRGLQQTLFDMANLLHNHRHDGVEPYQSIYAQQAERSSCTADTGQVRPVHA